MTAINPFARSGDDLVPPQRRPVLRWRLLLVTAVLVPLIGYFGVAGVIAAVTVTADGARGSLAAALVAALPGWLAAFQVPLSIGQAPLSALPLLPTIGVVVLIAKASAHVVRRSRVRRPEQALWVILTMAFAHALIGTALAIAIARLPGPVDVVPGDAFACCGLLAAAASTLGVVHRCGLLYLLWERVPGTLWWGLNRGLRAAGASVGVGALVLAGALSLSVPELVQRSTQAGSSGAVFGSAALSLLYLPDAVLAAWAYAAGPGFSVGGVTFSPLAGPPESPVLPALPLFAPIPDTAPDAWWAWLFAAPAVVGVLVGWSCRDAHESPRRRLRVVMVAATVVAVLVLVTGMVTGGQAGGGVLDPISVRPMLLAPVTWGWLALPAGVIAWFAGARPAAEPPERPGDAETVASEEMVETDDGAFDQEEPDEHDPEVDRNDEENTALAADPLVEDPDLPEGDDDDDQERDSDGADAHSEGGEHVSDGPDDGVQRADPGGERGEE